MVRVEDKGPPSGAWMRWAFGILLVVIGVVLAAGGGWLASLEMIIWIPCVIIMALFNLAHLGQ